MEKIIPETNVSGHVPIKDEQYKLLMGNCFTPYEIGMMVSSLGTTLRGMLNSPVAVKLKIKNQHDATISCIGKLLIALPDGHRKAMVKMLNDTLKIDFNIQEVEMPAKEQMQ